MNTINKILELLKQQGKKQKDLTDYLGVSKNLFTDWKSGRIKSYQKYLPQIADYLECSVDYLLGREESGDAEVKKLITDRIQDLADQKNITIAKLLKDINLSPSSFSMWKKRGTSPKAETVQKIADYLGCSVDYLLGREESGDAEVGEPFNLVGRVIPGNPRMIPVYETVSAGFGRQANDVVIDYIPLLIDSDYEAEHTICIRVSGNSMYPKIEDGDLIQVYKTDSIDNGRVGVFLIDETDGIVKRVFYNPGEDWLELHSYNPEYPPRRFEGPDLLRVRTLGLVKKIIKDI